MVLRHHRHLWQRRRLDNTLLLTAHVYRRDALLQAGILCQCQHLPVILWLLHQLPHVRQPHLTTRSNSVRPQCGSQLSAHHLHSVKDCRLLQHHLLTQQLIACHVVTQHHALLMSALCTRYQCVGQHYVLPHHLKAVRQLTLLKVKRRYLYMHTFTTVVIRILRLALTQLCHTHGTRQRTAAIHHLRCLQREAVTPVRYRRLHIVCEIPVPYLSVTQIRE